MRQFLVAEVENVVDGQNALNVLAVFGHDERGDLVQVHQFQGVADHGVRRNALECPGHERAGGNFAGVVEFLNGPAGARHRTRPSCRAVWC